MALLGRRGQPGGTQWGTQGSCSSAVPRPSQALQNPQCGSPVPLHPSLVPSCRTTPNPPGSPQTPPPAPLCSRGMPRSHCIPVGSPLSPGLSSPPWGPPRPAAIPGPAPAISVTAEHLPLPPPSPPPRWGFGGPRPEGPRGETPSETGTGRAAGQGPGHRRHRRDRSVENPEPGPLNPVLSKPPSLGSVIPTIPAPVWDKRFPSLPTLVRLPGGPVQLSLGKPRPVPAQSGPGLVAPDSAPAQFRRLLLGPVPVW